MIFKVDYNRVDKIGKDVLTEVKTLEEKRKELLSILEEMNNSWSGSDYDEFKENAKTYIDNLKIKFEELEYMAGFMSYASNRYSNNDTQWADKLKEYRDIDKMKKDDKYVS
ncbi:MAG: WXG100 family type VII secretion target [Bacilli bacterium]|nr:WXG100 family type VII secretion target [Bacilli bacterium]